MSEMRKVELGANGKVTGVKYFDSTKTEQFQRAKAVVVCANGAETPRLLLRQSPSLHHPLKNSNLSAITRWTTMAAPSLQASKRKN